MSEAKTPRWNCSAKNAIHDFIFRFDFLCGWQLGKICDSACLLNRLTDYAKNYYGRDWGKFAADAGLFSAVVEHGNGQSVTFVFGHEPSVDDVRQAVAAVAPEGLQWARFKGVVVYGDAAVRAAALSVPGLSTMTAGDAWAALGAVLGVSDRRARERVRAVGLTLDELRVAR